VERRLEESDTTYIESLKEQLRLAELAKIMKHAKRRENAASIETIAANNTLPQILPWPCQLSPLPTVTRDAPAATRDAPAFPMLPVVYPLPNLPEIRERETEDEKESDSGGSIIIFISEMDVHRKANIKRQEARWIELGLDKAVPHARLQTVTRAPTDRNAISPL
jgi:hypothetical protein